MKYETQEEQLTKRATKRVADLQKAERLLERIHERAQGPAERLEVDAVLGVVRDLLAEVKG